MELQLPRVRCRLELSLAELPVSAKLILKLQLRRDFLLVCPWMRTVNEFVVVKYFSSTANVLHGINEDPPPRPDLFGFGAAIRFSP
jgi:hypothetical protein